MERQIVEVHLPNGGVAYVNARQVEGGSATKTGIDKLDFQGFTRTLEGLSEAIHGAVAKAAPSKVSVEFGLELAISSGGLVGLVVDGDTTASIAVTLEWERGDDAPQAAN